MRNTDHTHGNARSSRSHAIFVTQASRAGPPTGIAPQLGQLCSRTVKAAWLAAALLLVPMLKVSDYVYDTPQCMG